MASSLRPCGGWMGMEKFMSEKWCEDFELGSLNGRKATFAKKPEWYSICWAAAEGWYYTNHENLIQCIGCNGQLRMPLSEIELRERHARCYPWCDVLNKRIKQYEQLRNFIPNRMLWHSAGHAIEYLLANPSNSAMKTRGARKDTFKGGKVANQWVTAGYYLPTKQEKPQCWYCGIRMPPTSVVDNVYVEHILASPGCEHMKRTVGYLKIKEIIEYFGSVSRSDKAEVRDMVEVDHKNEGK